MIRIQVNGEYKTLSEPMNLRTLLESLNLIQPNMAVAVNAQVIPQSQRTGTTVRDGDRIEIIRPVAGG